MKPKPHYRIVWVQYGVKRRRYHGYLTHPQMMSDVEYRSRWAATTRAQQVYDMTGGKIVAIAIIKVTPKPYAAGLDKGHAAAITA